MLNDGAFMSVPLPIFSLPEAEIPAEPEIPAKDDGKSS